MRMFPVTYRVEIPCGLTRVENITQGAGSHQLCASLLDVASIRTRVDRDHLH